MTFGVLLFPYLLEMYALIRESAGAWGKAGKPYPGNFAEIHAVNNT
jgi:hypothetical protein